MPQTKPYSQQQHIIHHTSHSGTLATTTSNPQHRLHQQSQHVQQINLAGSSSLHHQAQHHNPQQHPTPTTHMIQVSEEFLEQAANNHNPGNMMISTTGEVINQQQIFKIVSTDGTTGNMIIDATNQNVNAATTTSKVLLSNLTVLSKQQATAHGQVITNSQQHAQAGAQTINFVNAKNLYTASTTGGNMGGAKQQKFTVAAANVGNYKGSVNKQTSTAANAQQYIQQTNSIGQQKINITTGNRSMQMLTTTRVQNVAGNNATSNLGNTNSVAVLSNNTPSSQTMVLQQPQKFIANNIAGSKLTTTALCASGGNVIKKSTTAGTLRMNNSHNTSATTKLMNNMQATQAVKTFITQSPCVTSQVQQNLNQLTVQHHTNKGGSKSKFVKQYNNAILNSAGAVAIATLPHQHSNNQNNVQIQQQQHVQPQTAFINHHKSGSGSTKVNKINSKYAQAVNMAAQLPPGTQLHQKGISQTQQQQQIQQQHQQQHIQTSISNSNIKFVNAQGTVIQQQHSLTPQKINKHQQQQYQNVQGFDAVDGNHLFNQTNANQSVAVVTSSISSGTTTLPSSSTSTGTSLLTDDIMMVNGTQMTDELSARILQSMSQKSFSNQRYQQQQQNVFHPKTSTTTVTAASSSINTNNSSNNSNNNMLPPPPTQNTILQTNNNSNIILSPREYTLYSASGSAVGIVPVNQQQSQQQQQQQQQQPHTTNIHYNNSTIPTASASSNITAGSFSSNNYVTVSNNTNNMTTIASNPSGTFPTNGLLLPNTSGGPSTNGRQAHSAPGSRSQSIERKIHESSISRKSSEYYKVNNHNSLRGSSHQNNLANATASVAQTSSSIGNISSSISNLVATSTLPSTSPLLMSRPPSLPPSALLMEPQAQVIHLQATKSVPGANNSSNDDDDDIIGEEVRPAPVNTEDIRLRILHAVLFDHTYVNPMPSVLPTSFDVQLPSSTTSTSTVLTSATSSSITAANNGQQWSLGGIGAITAASGGSTMQKSYAVYGAHLPSSRLNQDEDTYLALNNTSRLAVGDIDPGEETETAPEAELEDDSVTRCICDLAHDDGYMICCDKCCAWQHVDCMGIDRQNIPDEYLCELCQPRVVDKVRARSLQLLKRKEQQQQLLLTAQAQNVTSSASMGANVVMGGGVSNLPNDLVSAQQRLTTSSGTGFALTGNMSSDAAALQLLSTGGTSNLKKSKMLKKVKDNVSGKRSKKSEKLVAAGTGSLTTSSKPTRKETKKNTKRKKAGAYDGACSTVGMTAAEKHAANLRQWIENYELAVTNHYSPELRARLHAISKQPSLLQSILNTENPILKEFCNGSLENRATTVPHAGGKILISKFDIVPNSPICELRGKYMLTTQYKTQNTSMNMNSPPPNNYHLASYKAHKTPGPFIFFYQLPSTEVAAPNQLVPQTTTTTMLNPDGTYTTTTTTLPAQQSPPTYLKGPEICVDTRTYGNEARFVRRSCRPNAEIQHLFEKGTIHLFIVALTDIRASTEITIRHEPHDLLAVENKKSFSIVIQPTSTLCACGFTKDCIFGPPLPQLPPASKSNAGRKSLTHTSGANAGNLTAKQRKANQQNLNRNRSISSSASGDSNMSATATATTNTVALSINSPSNINKIPTANKINNNTLTPLTTSCNSNLNNASNLVTLMHDSGVCTSSSSPSVSIPSPTQHIHSPIQQQQVHQQQLQQQLLYNTQMKSTVPLLPQQEQQKLMQSLPTPLVITSPNLPIPNQQNQQKSVLQQPTLLLPSHQALNVIAHTGSTCSPLQDTNTAIEEKHQQPSFCLPTQPTTEQPPIAQQDQENLIHQQIVVQEKEKAQPATQLGNTVAATSGVILENISADTTTAAAALHTLSTSPSPNAPLTSPSSASGNLETQTQPAPTQQQQFAKVPPTEATPEQQQTMHQQNQSFDNVIASTTTSETLSPQQSQSRLQPHQPRSQQQSQQLQQHKSPQKNNQSQHNSSHTVRKTPGKHGRTTSFSEDNNHHNHNEDSVATSTPVSSTPKDKPKLSREDRKMEAILKAIEKMERNQQRKQEQKQTKRQNAGSHNTSPTSPNKTDAGENNGGTKRSSSHVGTTGRSKKKRKTATKVGQASNQRKRRQSRMNSQESVDECNPNDNDPFISESEGCAAMHSPPIPTTPLTQPHFATSKSSSASDCITTDAKLTAETTSNANQAAGLLMAFANTDVNPPSEQQIQIQQSPHRSSSQYMLSSTEAATSPPPTPPSQVSSACLLIEAAVGPLEPNLNGNSSEIHNGEFKYPLQAKTKKHLMNNWLHQTEDNSLEGNVTALPEQHSQSLQTSVSSMACSDVENVSVVSGGLDSLLQAAMSDLKQSQTTNSVEEPQNLSIAAQKVEEFIQQTEASGCGSQSEPQTKHSYEYEQQQQDQRTSFLNLPTPVVDLTLKTPLTIGPHSSSDMSSSNFHLPLQVSTCSNNSSVKKRWLRQAISEESHEEYQQTYSSMTPSPTMGVINSTFSHSHSHSHSQLQSSISCSPATTLTNYVPNGFTTPLKKRRLLLTGTDETDENLSPSCGDLCANSIPSPPHILVQQENQPVLEEFQNKLIAENVPSRDVHEDLDVDVEKCEINETKSHQTPEDSRDIQYTKFNRNLGQDIDVTTSTHLEAPHVQNHNKIIVKHENEVPFAKVKVEGSVDPTPKQIDQSVLVEFNDQEDDVDILRSPSPGREMIKAEDNLVKIEPEDTSGMEDVKIDVEREESMAADDDVVTQHKERKEDKVFKTDEQNNVQIYSESIEIKKEFKAINADDAVVERKEVLERDKEEKSKAGSYKDLVVKTEHNESHTNIEDLKPKKIKLEDSEAGEQNLDSGKIALSKEESLSADIKNVKPNLSTSLKASQSQHCYTKDNEQFLKMDCIKKNKEVVTASEIGEVTSTSLEIKPPLADTTFADVEPSTPPPRNTALGSGKVPPIQRHKSLSDDDIQARLHSFHKENILFLQSRNKKTKSSTSLTTSNANNNPSSTNCLLNINDHHKNRTSYLPSSSSNYQHQANHHHHHHHLDGGKEKSSDKSSLKHRKHSSAAVSGNFKKQKLHKREKTSSSSSLNSNKITTLAQTPSSSSSSNKNATICSTSVSSGSSKKLKSLKKSSSGSSTSSNTSVASALAFQNCYPSNSSANANTISSNSEKDRSTDKDKHHKQRTTSTSSSGNNICTNNFHATSTSSYPSSKKRQLNFELELTKDMHLVNSVITGGSKHKRETSKLLSDEQIHVAAKKSRKETFLPQKEEIKNCSNNKLVKIEKCQEKKLSISNIGNLSNRQSIGFSISTSTQPTIAAITNSSTITTLGSTFTEEPKPIPTIVSQQSLSAIPLAPILREHPTIPHFNNVVIATNSTFASNQQATLTSIQSPLHTPLIPQNIPNHMNSSPSFISSVHSNYNSQLQQLPLPLTPPPVAGVSSLSSTPSANSASHLPFYNTIYGKLLDNSVPPPNLPTPLTPSNITTSPPSSTSSSVPTGSGVLSEYLDTKLKSYNTLGGYVSQHTGLFGLNNAGVNKDTSVSTAVSSSTSYVESTTGQIKESSVAEMPAPLLPTSNISGRSTTPPPSSANSNTAITALKIHTKTASHDPRLNPQLTAPEPPPQPKRKLSINEYRKRMKQSSSNDASSSTSNLTTPTTPTSLDPMMLLLGPTTMPLANKCTLNSPDRLTQSVDSQIQKDIMATTSGVSSSSSLDSLNSSNSSTSLNDTLLKSSSFVEEDSAKGQFNAAPTLLEKQQESLCARLKSLKEKESLGTTFSVFTGPRSRFSSFSENAAGTEFGLRKEDDDMDIIRHRNLSISSSIGGGDLLDNCLEEISSTSTSMSSSREPSPERCYTTHHKILTASATTTMTSSSATSRSNEGQTSRHHHQQQHHAQQTDISGNKSEMNVTERIKSVDTA